MGARVTSVLVAVAACVYAVAVDVIMREEIQVPYLAALALGALVASAIVLIVASSPYRAPFTRRSHMIAGSLAFTAVVLSAASQWNTNTQIRDDWGPLALGLILFAVAPYRPARELVEVSIISAAGVGLLTLLQLPSFEARLPPIVFVVVAVTPVLLLSSFAAAFAGGIVRSLELWRVQAGQDARNRLAELNATVIQSVQSDRLGVLNRDIVPFLVDVLDRGEILPADREKARLIADSMRSRMVAEVDRSWLASAMEQECAPGQGVEDNRLQDDDRLAILMTSDQRAALRALIGFLCRCPDIRQGSLQITITSDGLFCRTSIIATVTAGKRVVRKALTPYFVVLRGVFDDLQVQFEGPIMIVRFSYDRH